jgi:F0F1-type ATP synthase membrane subunit b/b'
MNNLTNEQIILYGLVIEAAFVGAVLGIMAFAYYRILNKFYNLKEEDKKLKILRDQKAQQLLELAQIKYQEIISGAHTKAQEIIGEAEIFKSESREEFKKELLAASKRESEDFKAMLLAVRQESVKAVSTELTSFRATLQEDLTREQSGLHERVEEEYKIAKSQVEVYKASLVTRVDESIYEIVKAISEKVMRRSLRLEEHEDLIIQALEEAKREHVL